MGQPSRQRSEARRRAERERIIARLSLRGNDVERMSLATLRLLERFEIRIQELEVKVHGPA